MRKSKNEFDNFDRTMRALIKVPHEKISRSGRGNGSKNKKEVGGPFKPFFGLSGAFFLVASRTYRRGSQVTAQKPGGNLGYRAKEY